MSPISFAILAFYREICYVVKNRKKAVVVFLRVSLEEIQDSNHVFIYYFIFFPTTLSSATRVLFVNRSLRE